MVLLKAPLYGRQVTVNRHSYTTDAHGQIGVTQQSDIDALRRLGWSLVQAPVPTPVPVPTPFPTVQFDSNFIHADSTVARMSTI